MLCFPGVFRRWAVKDLTLSTGLAIRRGRVVTADTLHMMAGHGGTLISICLPSFDVACYLAYVPRWNSFIDSWATFI